MTKKAEKARRTELQRATGSRAIPTLKPPRERGPQYLLTHACFDCRRSWKVRPNQGAKCPLCSQPLSFMGRSFKAPKKTALKQWEKVRALWNRGFRFLSYRSYPDAERLPEKLSEVEGFVRRNPNHPFRVVQ